MLLAAGIGLGVAALLGHGTWHRNSPLFGAALGRLPLPADGAPEVAITFDDGPNPGATPRILDVLRDEGVPATFFLLGRHVDRWPELAARVAAEGHAVGNHGWHHRKLHRRTPRYIRDDLGRGTGAIAKATGLLPRLFRAPHGFRNPWVSPAAAALGQRTVGWSLGVWDSAQPGAEEITRRALMGTRPGTILLLHDGDGYDADGDRTQTAEALPAIIHGLRERGYRFVTVPVR